MGWSFNMHGRDYKSIKKIQVGEPKDIIYHSKIVTLSQVDLSYFAFGISAGSNTVQRLDISTGISTAFHRKWRGNTPG
jgi:hypothetical protein